MKKLCFILTALLLTSAVYAADVTITCNAPPGSNEVTVSYVADMNAHIPRAFGLDVKLDNAQTITSLTPLDPNYWVYPGTIDINQSGVIESNGTGIGQQDDAAYPDTLYGLDSNGITIEMGSLHWPTDCNSPNAPDISNDLFKFTVSGNCTVTISGNAARGKVVLYDATQADVATVATDVYAQCTTTIVDECLKSTATGYADWLGQPAGVAWSMPWNKPDCWCYPRQCRGDADGAPSYPGVPIWVDLTDLNILRGAIGIYVTNPPPGNWPAGGECANFDHQMSYPGVPIPVDLADLNILREYIGDYGTVPCCDENGDCTIEPSDPNYVFWTGPTTP
jgi:hypothetical protein